MKKGFQEFKMIRTTGIAGRIGLLVLLLLCLALSWFAIAGQLGNMIADVTQPTDENAEYIAKLASSISPRDPLTNWLAAAVLQDSSTKSVEGFESAVRLAPGDYTLWGQLGRSYELADRPAEAEKALKRAIELAPNYVLPRWQIGNFYLRLGREDDAMRELGLAAERDPVYRDQVFSVVFDYFERDTGKLEQLAASKPDVIAGLARFYAAKGLPELSIAAWNRLNQQEQAKNSKVSELISQSLFDKGYFKTSVEFSGKTEKEKGAKVGKVFNGGFESEVFDAAQGRFTWNFSKTEGLIVKTSRFKKHSGAQSLEAEFSGFDKPSIGNIYQMIAVEPGKQYKISFWLKTDRLASAGLPVLEVTNAIDSTLLAKSEPFPAGTNDWRQISVVFRVPEKSEGIAIRTNREYCGESCILTGLFWYDDFELVALD